MNNKTAKRLFLALALISGTLVMIKAVLTRPAIKEVRIAQDVNMDSLTQSEDKHENPAVWNKPSVRDFMSMTWEFLTSKEQRIPSRKLPSQPVDLDYFYTPGSDQLNATWLGHSSLMINLDGFRILTDPVFEKKVSIFGPTRFDLDFPIQADDIKEIDAVIISHNHYDHLNKNTIQLIKDEVEKFYVPLRVGALLIKWGVSSEKIIELGWWDEINVDENTTIAATPAQHFSGRGLTDRDRTLWASWVVKSRNHSIFYSGDSGYFKGYKAIGEKYGPFDLTFLECGAYNEAWRFVHMMPEETAQAHLDLKGDVLHPIHWGTFNLALHPWFEPMNRLTAVAPTAGIRTATPVPGQTTVYGGFVPTLRWWEELEKLSRPE